MDRVFPDIRPGDRLVGVSIPGREARFYSQERLLGTVRRSRVRARLLRHLARREDERAGAARAACCAFRTEPLAVAARPTSLQLAAYGALGLPLAMAALPIYVHVPKFYADTLGLSLAGVGAILLAARIVDAVQDPLLGWWSDRSALARRQPVGVRRRRRAAPRAGHARALQPARRGLRRARLVAGGEPRAGLHRVQPGDGELPGARRGDHRRRRRAHARDGLARGLRARGRLPRRGAAGGAAGSRSGEREGFARFSLLFAPLVDRGGLR